MVSAPLARLMAAVELNPDRSRVTLRRDDVRSLLAEHQRQAADIDRLTTSAVRAGEMLAGSSVTIERLGDDLTVARDERDTFSQAARRWHEHARRTQATMIDAAWLMPRAWVLYAASAFAGAMVGHG